MSSLTQNEIAAIFRYGVGVGSEGANPGLGLAGWVQRGSGQFDAGGNPINSDTIIANSGYTVGTLQWDFGQKSSSAYQNANNGFLQSFLASSQAQSLTDSNISHIISVLPQNGRALKNSGDLLNQTEFNALNSYLMTSDGISAANQLDNALISAGVSTGSTAADLAQEAGGDELT